MRATCFFYSLINLTLPSSFGQVHRFLEHQGNRPFIKRYLKRDEIQRHIVNCDSALNDALSMFSVCCPRYG